MSAILKDEPPTLLGSGPEELQRIVRKCMEKDRNPGTSTRRKFVSIYSD
jgi:hypothetical protein